MPTFSTGSRATQDGGMTAPLFFGHSGLRIDGDALTWPSILASLSLVAIAMVTKIVAVYLHPPAAGLGRRQALGLGALLQCKGLMEIVAATILHQQGMLSEFAFASLVVLAVISTTLTGPLFRFLAPRGREEAAPRPVTGPSGMMRSCLP